MVLVVLVVQIGVEVVVLRAKLEVVMTGTSVEEVGGQEERVTVLMPVLVVTMMPPKRGLAVYTLPFPYIYKPGREKKISVFQMSHLICK